MRRQYLLLALLFAVQSHAQPIRAFSQETIERLGRAIYEQDLVSARSTDAMLDDHKAGRIPDAERRKIAGWIVVGTPDQAVAKFIAEGEQGPYVVAAYTFSRAKDPPIAAAPSHRGALSSSELAHFRARQMAIKHVAKPCAGHYNMVVLPNTGGGGFLVYALAATTKHELMMVGGHYRFTVSADGRKVMQADELFRSCLAVNLDASMLDKPQKSATVTRDAVIFIDEVSPAPLETHVFLSLLHKRTVAVTTGPDAVWIVSHGRIRRMKSK